VPLKPCTSKLNLLLWIIKYMSVVVYAKTHLEARDHLRLQRRLAITPSLQAHIVHQLLQCLEAQSARVCWILCFCKLHCRNVVSIHSTMKQTINSHHFFASPPYLTVAWKANVSHGLLLMLLTLCPSGLNIYIKTLATCKPRPGQTLPWDAAW